MLKRQPTSAMASLCLLLIVIIGSSSLAIGIVSSTPFQTETKYPCAFIDTVNITGSYAYDLGGGDAAAVSNSSDRIADGNHTSNLTYMHKWMVIPRDLVAVYDFIIHNGQRVSVERHLRACVCKLKPCIRFCCAQDYYYDVVNHTCSNATQDHIDAGMDQSSMWVSTHNGSLQRVVTQQNFSVHIGTPCERMRSVLRDNKEPMSWTLYENGTIAHKQQLFSRHYCYTPFQLANKTWIWQPLACAIEKLPFVLGVREWTYAISLMISTICMGIILLIHLFCTEIRNTFYGVAIKAYTICVIIGYSLLIHLLLTDPSGMSKFACAYIPCFVLLYQLLSFYILTFISFNFYLNFHGIILTKLMFWLIFFPILMLAVGWSLFVGYAHYDGKPVFGGDTCWFDPRNWAIMVYLYAPIFVACVVSIFFYILTLIHITECQENELKNSTTAVEENRYKSFWIFFSYTFITYLVQTVSFAINYYRNERTHINYAVCLVVALHGCGSLYALIGKNQQIQNFLRRIEDDIEEDDEEICESALPMTPLE